MRRANRTSLTGHPSSRRRAVYLLFRAQIAVGAIAAAAFVGCDGAAQSKSSSGDRSKSAAADHSKVRAERRAYDGAPPVIPHMRMGTGCTNCHSQTGIQFGEMGFAPPMPHSIDADAFARCEQCHVYAEEQTVFAENDFIPLRQDLRKGRRATSTSPPVMPHPVFMRENCAACHTGPAAREEIRCTHPERVRCGQCHVPATDSGEFTRSPGPAI